MFRTETAICAVSMVLGIALISAGCPARADTLEQALVTAYQENAQLLAERARLRGVDDNVPQALANWRPQVSITAEQGVDHFSSKQDCGKAPESLFFGVDCSYKALNNFANLWPQSYGLTVTQPLYRGGRTVAQTSQALNQVRSERATLINTEESVFMTVIGDYANIVLEQKVVQLSRDNEQAIRSEAALTDERLRRGELTKTDLAQAEAAFEQASATRRAAEAQLTAYRAAYKHDVGDSPAVLDDPPEPRDLPTKLTDAEQLAATANPAVIAALFAVDAGRDNVRLVDGQRLPTVTLQGSISRAKETGEQSGLRDDNIQAIAQLNVPLYQGGAIQAQSHQAAEQVELLQHQVDDARRTAVQATTQAWEQRAAALESIVILEREVVANEAALVGLKQESRVGNRTVYDILVQEQTSFQAKVSLAQARHDKIVAGFTILQAIGNLTAISLGLRVPYYDPDINFHDVRDPDGPFDLHDPIPIPKWLPFFGDDQ